MFHTILAPGSLDGGTGGITSVPTGSETIDITIGANLWNLNLWNYINTNIIGASGYKNFNVTIAATSLIGSLDTSLPAITTGTGWPSNAVLTITNNGTISGKGGAGGNYGATTPTAGSNGGDAIVFTLDATLTNSSTGIIQGGGGGGGGGNTTGTTDVGGPGQKPGGEEQETTP